MKNLYERQNPLTILVQLTPEDIAGGGFTAKVPRGAWLTNVVGLKNTGFNTAGSTPTVTLTVTDGTTVFINAQTIANTGAVTAAATSKFFPNGGTITGTITEGVASGDITTATVGDVVLRFEYVQLGVGRDVQG